MTNVLCAQLVFLPYTHLLHVFKQLCCDNFFTIKVVITSNYVTMFGAWASF